MTFDDLHFEILDEKHSVLLESFSCQEDIEFLKDLNFNKSIRKKIVSHNKDIENFIKNEALLEQSVSLNTTHLMLSNDNKLVGFISFCNDCIPLEPDEKDTYGFTYATIPALKIARLAIATEYQHQKLSNLLIIYAIYVALTIRKYSGLPFITLDCYKHRMEFYKSKHHFIINSIQHDSKADDRPISMRMYVDEYLEKLYNGDIVKFKE